MRRLLGTALAGALATAAALMALTPAAGAATRCAPGVKPTHVSFHRVTGRHVGKLTWRSAHSGRASHRAASMHYRVMRGHDVVGQTSGRSIRVPVALKHSYRFTVIPAGRAGLEPRCAASRRVHVRYRLPTKPKKLSVSGKGAKRQFTWRRARPGDDGLAGYRLKRNGSILGQTRRTKESVHVSPGRTYRFQVVAVDRHGLQGAGSNVVVVHTKGSAAKTKPVARGLPTTPANVQAGALSNSEIAVSWNPSTEQGGKIVGYRVMNDGSVVGQFKTTSASVSGLRANTAYTITVAAVDSGGQTSAPSAPVQVTTGNPPPSTGHAQAFILGDTDQSFLDFETHYQQIGVIYPTYYTCNAAGSLLGGNNALWTQWAQARAVKVLPRINCQNSSTVNEILTDPTMRSTWLSELENLVSANGYDGLSIDFEAGPASDRSAMTSFITTLAQALHSEGKLLSLSISATTDGDPTESRAGIFDYQALGNVVDYPVVMSWGLHWATSAPGSQDPISWVQQVLAYVASLPDHAKFIAGFNLYAMDWPNGGGTSNPASTYEYGSVAPLLAQFGAAAQLDSASDSMTASYTDAGVSHVVWFETGATEAARIQLVKTDGLGGVAFWRLGEEDQTLWSNPLLAPGVSL